MYDTIDIILNREKAENIILLDYVPQFLERPSEHYFNNRNNCSITGYNNGLKIIVNENSVKIKDSSICKWFLNDNIQTMHRGDLQRAVEKLSDILHLPINKADVTRFDLAHNLLLENNLSLYMSALGPLNYFNRGLMENGLYYYGANGKLAFYDKIKEAKVKGISIPSLYNDKNLLRYERRFEKRVCKQLNIPELVLSKLYDDKFYSDIIDRWAKDYFSIDKIKQVKKIDYAMVKSKTELYTQALLFYIDGRGGLMSVLEEVKLAQKAGNLTKKQAQDLRDKYKEVSSNKLFVDETEYIKELDRKIKSIQKNYR